MNAIELLKADHDTVDALFQKVKASPDGDHKDLFEQIKGFGSYGFPESHAASFALITWTSCWLKYHEPAAFTCGLINSAPMGFYSPDQLLQDARRHGIRVLPVDVRYSTWDCVLETQDQCPSPGLRPPSPARAGEGTWAGF